MKHNGEGELRAREMKGVEFEHLGCDPCFAGKYLSDN
jgi:hypothetical protein